MSTDTEEKKEVEEERCWGVTDLPCGDDSQDDLDFVKYVDGLEEFVRECPTPMSIAIQGDWGTGKTSMINMLRRRLESKAHSEAMPCVYFNTWQYSQFNMADDLYLSFVDTLLSKCCDENEKKEFIKTFAVIMKKYAVHTVEERTGIDIEPLLESQQKRVDSVSRLKDSFQEIIGRKAKAEQRDRIIIFIDDLDRLNPEIAVELLEVIKLFMDVQKCVFILAIDYDVVVSGVRKKYGENISEEKCRSFFDKIIQLPFTMPVNTYNLQGMIDKVFGEYIKNGRAAVTILINEMLDSNPRAFKRLANSFCMIEIVSDKMRRKNERDLERALLLGILCIQISVPKLYDFLAENAGDLESILSLRGMELKQAVEKEHMTIADDIFWKIEKGMNAVNNMVNGLEKECDRHELYNILDQTLNMSSVTSIDNSKGRRAAAMKVTKIQVNDVSVPVKNPTEALVKSFEMLLQDDTELVQKFMEAENSFLTMDSNRSDSVFRSKKKLENIDGIELYLGTSTGSSVKKLQLEKLCRFLNQEGKKADVKWFDGSEVV